jgi:hypothetical protein
MGLGDRVGSERNTAQASVLGFVLLVGIVVVGTGTLVVVGGTLLSEQQRAADASVAELAMTQMDSQASQVALGSSPSQRVSLAGGGRTYVDESAAPITIELIGCDTCPTTLESTTLGSVVYDGGETTVAYEGGGVWKRDGSGGVRMVSPPELHYSFDASRNDDPTLTLPLVLVRGDASTTDALRIRRGPSTAVFPDPDDPSGDLTNPLGAGSLRITIRSPYYEGWSEYFEGRTDADSVTVDHGTETVEAVLTVPDRSREVEESIASNAPTLSVQGGADVDSYNSSLGSYAATRGSAGSVYVGHDLNNAGDGTIYGDMRVDGDFDGGGGIEIEGDLLTDGDVALDGGVSVDGEVIADGDFSISGGGTVNSPVTVTGSVTETGGGVDVAADVTAGRDYVSKSGSVGSGVTVHVGRDFYAANGQNVDGEIVAGGEYRDDGVWPNDGSATITENGPAPDLSATERAESLSPPHLAPIDGTITSRVVSYESVNDNGPEAARVAAGNCGGGDPACTLTAGTYHFDELSLSGSDRLVFDTTGGPIYVAVNGDVGTTGGSSVEAIGPNEVHLYYTGDATLRTDWESVGDRGDQIWLYGSSSSTVLVQGGATVYGVLYAPGNQDIEVRGGSEVYGALVGSVSDVQGGTAVHYDEVLGNQKPELTSSAGAPVNYLHISTNEIVVERVEGT